MSKNFYFTFGSDTRFPFQNCYILIVAQNKEDAIALFREKYPDRHKNCINCSFVYDQKHWERVCADGCEYMSKDSRPAKAFCTVDAFGVPQGNKGAWKECLYVPTAENGLYILMEHGCSNPAAGAADHIHIEYMVCKLSDLPEEPASIQYLEFLSCSGYSVTSVPISKEYANETEMALDVLMLYFDGNLPEDVAFCSRVRR